jgi:hypothetical protein
MIVLYEIMKLKEKISRIAILPSTLAPKQKISQKLNNKKTLVPIDEYLPSCFHLKCQSRYLQILCQRDFTHFKNNFIYSKDFNSSFVQFNVYSDAIKNKILKELFGLFFQ